LAFAVIFFPAFLLIWSWPNVYRSTATVLVEPQQIPEDLVKSTVTGALETRLEMISEEIFSRARLQALIDQFGLYEDLKSSQPIEAVIERMRKDISLELKRSEAPGSSTVAFSVSYQGADANRVANVTNTLASFFIEENLKIREEQASSTSQFFRLQLEQAKQGLQEIEQQLSDTKRAHLDRDPGQSGYQALMLTHESRTEFYRSLLRHQMEAELAENMEAGQKGEQFRIVDPAFVSEVPSPNRPLLWAIAFLVALGVAGAVSIRPRKRLASPHSAEELANLDTSIQISVPKTVTLRDGSRGRMLLLIQAVATILSLMILLGAFYWLVLVNERLPTLMR
jgi:uncharacterized protein involved in exopolysaccharide biosynthesis